MGRSYAFSPSFHRSQLRQKKHQAHVWQLKLTKTCYHVVNIVSGPYGDLISPLVIEISAQTNERLHVKIYDPNDKRWEVPDRWDKSYHICTSSLPLPSLSGYCSFSSIPDDPSSPPSSTLYSWYYPSLNIPFFLSVSRYLIIQQLCHHIISDIFLRKRDQDIIFNANNCKYWNKYRLEHMTIYYMYSTIFRPIPNNQYCSIWDISCWEVSVWAESISHHTSDYSPPPTLFGIPLKKSPL